MYFSSLCSLIGSPGAYGLYPVYLSVCLQKTVTLGITFEWQMIQLTYFTRVFLVVQHFLCCQGQGHLSMSRSH